MSLSDVASITSQLQGYVTATPTAWPAFTGGQLDAYNAIVATPSIGGPSKLDPRDVSHFPPLDPSVLDQATKPASVSDDDWSAVKGQLTTDLTFLTEIDGFFNKFSDFLTFSYVDSVNYLTSSLVPDITSENEFTFVVSMVASKLLNAGISAIGGAEFTGAGVVAGALGALAQAFENSSTISSNDFSADQNSVGTKLSTAFNDMLTTMQDMEQSILGSATGATQMGTALQNATLSWPADDKDARTAATNAVKLTLWQQMLPAVWNLMSYDGDPTYHSVIDDDASFYQANPCYYRTKTADGSGYDVSEFWLGRGTTLVNGHTGSDDMGTELFVTLNVPRSDIFNQQNGWTGFTKSSYLVGGGCGGGQIVQMRANFVGQSKSDTASQLATLRNFRTKLQQSGGAMGSWYISVYNAVSNPIADLYNQTNDANGKYDPNSPGAQIQSAITQYNGEQLFQNAMALMSTGKWPAGVDVNDQIGNASAILGVIEQAASSVGGAANNIVAAVNQVLPFVGDYMSVASESDLLKAIAAETPPSTVFDPTLDSDSFKSSQK